MPRVDLDVTTKAPRENHADWIAVQVWTWKVLKMKRACPFEDNLTPLVKCHFSERDFVASQGGMESVYAKTLALLFSGANKKMSENNNVAKSANVRSCVSCVRSNSLLNHEVSFKVEFFIIIFSSKSFPLVLVFSLRQDGLRRLHPGTLFF